MCVCIGLYFLFPHIADYSKQTPFFSTLVFYTQNKLFTAIITLITILHNLQQSDKPDVSWPIFEFDRYHKMQLILAKPITATQRSIGLQNL